MDIPQELGAAFVEASSSLATTTVGTSTATSRSTLDPHRIWREVIDEDAGRIRVATVA